VPALKALPALPLPARREMAMALGDLAGSAAVNDLARLATAPDAETRLIAVDALGKIGGPRAVTALKGAVGDVNESVRAEAVRSLGQLAVKEAKKDPVALEEAAVKDLFLDVVAGDPSEYVREVADEALTAIRGAGTSQAKTQAERAPAISVST
jgi:HEAT repeat protein